jgi:hypothetical protein
MSSPLMPAPPGYHELCAKLRDERDVTKFRALVEEINLLLTDYEKRNPCEPSDRERIKTVIGGTFEHPDGICSVPERESDKEVE